MISNKLSPPNEVIFGRKKGKLEFSGINLSCFSYGFLRNTMVITESNICDYARSGGGRAYKLEGLNVTDSLP